MNKGSFLFRFAALCLLFFVCLSPASMAQVKKVWRMELQPSDTHVSLDHGVHVIPDPDKKLTYGTVAALVSSGSSPFGNTHSLVNLGLDDAPRWIVFSLNNMSDHSTWLFDIGSLHSGRSGFAGAIKLYDFTNQTLIYDQSHAPSAASAFPIPISLNTQDAHQFILYVEPQGVYPRSLALSLKRTSQDGSVFALYPVTLIAFVLLIGAFIGLSSHTRSLAFGPFLAGYYGVLALLYVLSHHFYVLQSGLVMALGNLLFAFATIAALIATKFFLRLSVRHPNEQTLLYALAGFSGICGVIGALLPTSLMPLQSLLVFIPSVMAMGLIVTISLLHYRRTKKAGLFYGLSFLLVLLSTLITGMAAAGFYPLSAMVLNGFWFTVIFQGGLLLFAANRQSVLTDEREDFFKAKQIQDIQAVERLRKSKSSVDQSKLIRVIEREREMMSELREREMQRTEDMRKAKDMADQANAAKSSFLAMISHEIRTPMNGVIGTLKLLKHTGVTKEQNDLISTIHSSTDSMMTLINDILDFEKIEKGQMTLENIPFDLKKLIDETMTLMQGYAQEHQLQFLCDYDPSLPSHLLGDPTRLRQVLLNLISNACKFTESGHVKVIVRQQKVGIQIKSKPRSKVYFAIEDTGVGISPKALTTLFDPFKQADESISRKYGGSGLGLAICRSIIEAMSGIVEIDSTEGEGSTFYFSVTFDCPEQEETNLTSALKVSSHLNAMNILVVEDNELNQKVLLGFLEKNHHVVTCTESGEEALKLCENTSFDVILMDIWLTGISGIDTAKMIKALPGPNKKTPIIGTSGNTSEETLADLKQAGIEAHIEKPIHYETLMEALESVRQNKAPSQGVQDVASYLSAQEGALDGAPNSPQTAAPSQTEDLAPYSLDPEIFDMNILDSFVTMLGGKAIHDLFESYTTKGDELVATLASMDAQSDTPEDFFDRAHELRGMAANFGLKKISALAEELETLAQKKDLTQASGIIQNIGALHERSKGYIAQWLKTL